jgi:hypothetical protein
MPHLDSLDCIFMTYDERNSALIEFLQTHGRFLRYLKLRNSPSLIGSPGPISNKLSLCSNLQTLTLQTALPLDILSLDPHSKLEILVIDAGSWAEPYLARFEEFTSLWRTRFPNLHVAMFSWTEIISLLTGELARLEIRFRTEDSFYTVKRDETTYRRWEGKWIGDGTLVISVENSADATSCTRCSPSSTQVD